MRKGNVSDKKDIKIQSVSEIAQSVYSKSYYDLEDKDKKVVLDIQAKQIYQKK